MTRHTPPRPVILQELFPELVPWRRQTVRIHPRHSSPSYDDGSAGGPLLRSAHEPWPVRAEEHCALGNSTPYAAEHRDTASRVGGDTAE